MAAESNFTFRASEQQKRLWSLQDPGGFCSFCCQGCLALPRGLEAAALLQAAARIVERHEILRTTFRRRPGVRFPFQVVGSSGAVQWREAEITDGRFEEILREERSEPFDLGNGPVVRLAFLRREEQGSLLVITLPALCADLRSQELFAAELLGFATGKAGFAEEGEPLQYADFTRWQEEMLAGNDGDMTQAREYWGRFLSDRLGDLSLASRREGSVPFEAGFVRCALAAEVGPGLEDLARRHGAGVPAFALAAWMTFLWRLGIGSGIGGIGDIGGIGEGLVVGRLAAACTMEELETCLGPIAVVVPVAAPLAESRAFVGLWTAVEDEIREGDRWPELAPRPPAWPLQFDAQGPRGDRWLHREFCGEPFELTLVISSGGAFAADLWYDRRLCSPAEAERLAGRFAVLLRGAVRDPGSRLGELELLTPKEYWQLVLEPYSGVQAELPDRCVHELFAEEAAKHPERIAVVSEEGRLTAGELDERSNRLANHLRAFGVGPEVRVAVFLERSCDAIVAFLGVLKAGGAYVPLDSAFPRERLAAMLEQAQPAAVITQERLLESLPDPSTHPARRICLDAEAGVIARQDARAPASGVRLENLLYLLFTSGSSGRPKGVAVEHRQLLHYLAGALERLDPPEGASFATVSTLAADLGNTSIFPALVRGGTLHVLSREQASDPSSLADAFARDPVDILKIVPSHLSALLLSERSDAVLPRRLLILGGEASSRELIEQVRAQAPELRIVNHYGPTETTVGATTWTVPEPLSAEVSRLPLGHPLPGARTYLLNSVLQPVPVGVTGEIYIGGGGVARGYLGAPDQTAERFLPEPFSGLEGQRFYRTGDLARQRPDGSLEFLGRADSQVKIRGFRIELGEIEAVLQSHPDLWECAVVAEESGAEPQLVAYVVPRRQHRAFPADLRGHLAERLPGYMLPAVFVRLEALPLTPNGKLDRRALPPPGDDPGAAARGSGARPRNLLELELVKIWEDLLHLSPIGTDESFFEIGGHSLLAVRLMAQIEKRLNCPLPLAALYRSPTIGELAKLLESDAKLAEPSPLVPIQAHGGRPPFFCVHPMGGEVLCYYHLSRALGKDQPFYGLQAAGLEQPADGDLSIPEMAAQYLGAIRAVAPTGPYLVGGYSFGCKVAFEIAHQLRRIGEEVSLLALLDGGAPGKDAQLERVNEAIFVAQTLREEARQAGEEFAISFEEIRGRDLEAQLPYVLEQAKLQQRLPAEVDVPIVRQFLNGIQLRQRASAAYSPAPYPDHIVYFRSTDLDSEYLEVLRESGYDVDDPTKGWARFAVQPIEIHDIPGLHEMLMRPPAVEELARSLRAVINRLHPTYQEKEL
jgi:amino acid adenylation domain-containing protein